MFQKIFSLTNIFMNILKEKNDIFDVDFREICTYALGKDIPFGVYIETRKGFLSIFKSERSLLLKDVILESEISKKLKSFDDGSSWYYFDLLLSSRKLHKKVLVRIFVNSSNLSDQELSMIESVVSNFYSFQDLYDKNYVFGELIGILKETTEVEDINEVIEKITSITKKLLDVQASSILLRDEKSNDLYFKVVDSEKSDRIKEIRVPIDKGVAGYTVRTGKSLIVNDVSNHPDFYSGVDEKSGFITKSLMSVPIRPLGKIIGVIEVINKLKETEFSDDDLRILETISEVLGINIINSLLYERLNSISSSIIKSLITALEARDEYTKGHSFRVQIYSIKLGNALRFSQKRIKQLELSAILHDIGKIGVPDSILRKPGTLTDEEFEVIKKHPVIGYNILSSIDGLDEVLEGIKYHHERFDGKGYPDGLKGQEIPIFARIISIADTLDAMTSDRPYRKGLPFEFALEEIKKSKGTQLDPELVDIFINSFTSLEEISSIIKEM
ncbi:MAG: HD domain-containing protein [Brevinematales bacterium]|nr:HD domain-containing protein [Brevinematales bacterium]